MALESPHAEVRSTSSLRIDVAKRRPVPDPLPALNCLGPRPHGLHNQALTWTDAHHRHTGDATFHVAGGARRLPLAPVPRRQREGPDCDEWIPHFDQDLITATQRSPDSHPRRYRPSPPLRGPARGRLPGSQRRRVRAVKVEGPTGRTTLDGDSAGAHSKDPIPAPCLTIEGAG